MQMGELGLILGAPKVSEEFLMYVTHSHEGGGFPSRGIGQIFGHPDMLVGRGEGP